MTSRRPTGASRRRSAAARWEDAGLVTYVTAGDRPASHGRDPARRSIARARTCWRSACLSRTRWPTARSSACHRACAGVRHHTLPRAGSARTPPAGVARRSWSSAANPILRLGAERFADRARAAGVDGVLVLDLPIEEADGFRNMLASRRIDTILLLSPTTTDERLRKAASLGSGFLYAISRLGVTGARDRLADGAQEMVQRIRRVSDLPVALGFGISKPEHVRELAGGPTPRWSAARSSASSPTRAHRTIWMDG